jgi:hypothetical protein
VQNHSIVNAGTSADKQYLKILELAARESEVLVETAIGAADRA